MSRQAGGQSGGEAALVVGVADGVVDGVVDGDAATVEMAAAADEASPAGQGADEAVEMDASPAGEGADEAVEVAADEASPAGQGADEAVEVAAAADEASPTGEGADEAVEMAADEASPVGEGADAVAVETITTPTPIQYTRETTPNEDELIAFNKNCYLITKTGQTRLPSSAKRIKNMYVSKLASAVTDSRLTEEQQVFTLNEAMKRKKVRPIAVSAGVVVPGSMLDIERHVMINIRACIKTARKTNNRRGRPTDDIRSVVQSIVLATLDPPNFETTEKTPTRREVARALGMPLTTYQYILKSVVDKRIALEYRDRNTVFSQVVKSKGWTKVDLALRNAVHDWIRKHPMVVESPIMNDMVRIPDPNDETKTIRTSKLLLSISVRELHNDMLELLAVAKSPEGDILISDTKLRQILPKQLRRMSAQHK